MLENVGKIREASGMTQEQVANSIGIGIGTYRAWEYCQRSPRGEYASKLADLFGVSVDDLIGRKQAIQRDYIEVTGLDKSDVRLLRVLVDRLQNGNND